MSRILAGGACALAAAWCVHMAHGNAVAQPAEWAQTPDDQVAQYQATPPPADAGTAKPAPAEGEATKAAPTAPRKRPPLPPATEAVRERGVLSLQCDWLGKRIVSLLIRDDPDAAQDFIPFYQRFACADDHLSRAFGCAVANLEQVEHSALAELIDACWRDPAVRLAIVDSENKPDNPGPSGGKPAAPLPKP